MIPTWIQVGYLAAAVCFILALKGLSTPRTARNGNALGAIAAVAATVVVFFQQDLDHVVAIIVVIAVGTVIGVIGARRVQMTQMPQLVALFNGVGGGAAALVALLELHEFHEFADVEWFTAAATAFTIVVGSISFAGSMVTFAKLQELMTTRPVVFPAMPIVSVVSFVVALALCVAVVIDPSLLMGILLALLGLALGVLLVLPVGGADVPIVISLLNAFTGLTVAAGGYVLANTLLLVAGTLVGASGTLLTILMARAMGRSVVNTLFGALRGGSTLGAGSASDRPVRSAGPDDVAILLAYAQRVIIVPGYGLAVAQAQHTLRELVDVLGERGIEVDYAIHPVAGRMPGHMNVLLAEALTQPLGRLQHPIHGVPHHQGAAAVGQFPVEAVDQGAEVVADLLHPDGGVASGRLGLDGQREFAGCRHGHQRVAVRRLLRLPFLRLLFLRTRVWAAGVRPRGDVGRLGGWGGAGRCGVGRPVPRGP